MWWAEYWMCCECGMSAEETWVLNVESKYITLVFASTTPKSKVLRVFRGSWRLSHIFPVQELWAVLVIHPYYHMTFKCIEPWCLEKDFQILAKSVWKEAASDYKGFNKSFKTNKEMEKHRINELEQKLCRNAVLRIHH